MHVYTCKRLNSIWHKGVPYTVRNLINGCGLWLHLSKNVLDSIMGGEERREGKKGRREGGRERKGKVSSNFQVKLVD